MNEALPLSFNKRMKVAVIYVKEGQEESQEMFGNTHINSQVTLSAVLPLGVSGLP